MAKKAATPPVPSASAFGEGVSEPTIHPRLKVVGLDTQRCAVRVACEPIEGVTPEEDLQDQNELLSTEDAKILAMRYAREHGVSSPLRKHASMHYGDPETGKVDPTMKGCRPFLVVEYYSEAAEAVVGDSQPL